MKFLKNKLAVTVILLSVSFLILIGVSAGRKKSSFIESGFSGVINELQGGSYKFFSGTSSFFSSISDYNDTIKENSKLKKKNNKLLDMEQKYKTLEKENKDYRDMLNFENTRDDYKFKGADVIARPSGDWIDALTINMGSNNGIASGMVVVDKQGCLVGKVTYVNEFTARVETIINSNINVSAMVSTGTSEDNGIVKSYRGAWNEMLCSLNSIPKDSTIKKDDVVVTQGLEKNYPENIRIGTVTDVQEDKGKMAKTATIKPFAEFNKLREVAIIIPNDTSKMKY